MIKRIDSYFYHEDERGSLKGLVNFGTWKEMNMITTVSGTTRGNHFHRQTTELFIILDGKIKVQCQKVNSDQLEGEVVEEVFEKGDVFLIEPMTMHTFDVLEDARWINALDLPIDPKSPDLHRL